MNAKTLYPYDIIRSAMYTVDPDMIRPLDATWKSLPNYADSKNALAVIDVSLSMYETKHSFIEPITIALSLGIYFAEHSTGHFANHFITFSKEPQLIDLGNTDIVGKIDRCLSYCEAANTDLFSVFVLILATAIKNKLPQSELPETIYLISDMEFDKAISCDKTVFEVAKKTFEEYGYTLPKIVFWNVAARNDNFPITFKENGTALVSGSSPVLFSQILSQDLTPVNLMEQVLGSERYHNICA